MSRLDLRAGFGRWLDASGPEADIVFSSRVRVARNFAGTLFVSRAPAPDLARVVDAAREALAVVPGFEEGLFIDAAGLGVLEAAALVERHLASPDFIAAQHPRALFVSADQTRSVMVNEEDHLRAAALASGLALAAGRFELDELDDLLEANLGFAFSDELGFLTACPTNVGTGMHASVLVHLPALALTHELDRVLRGIAQVGFSVRGLHGEGTETRGHLFQIANQTTLGVTEAEIVENLTATVHQLIRFERKARDYLLGSLRTEIEDKVFRARALLRHARLMTSEEVTNLLSAVRLGVALGLVTDVRLARLNELLVATQPANLQLILGRELAPTERDAARAEFVRQKLTS